MSKNRFDLDPERLATTDEHGNRVYIYPEDVKGKWKDRRTKVYWALIFFYLVLPWIYINEKPALMLNIAKREFSFFGQTLYGVEPILIFLIFISGLFFIAFMTSVFGRVWCGWGCPQTVFIQSIFLKIEALIEGKARARLALEQAPWSITKVLKRVTKWILFTLVSLHIAHTFVGYFVGPRELFLMTTQAPTEHYGVFIAVMILSTIFLLDFGWFREQFCIIACPYGRIQSVMMDENSKVVAYDYNRGEPRKGVSNEKQGDCVTCYQCVKVCPTGIDIRRGTQMECIACTQCIDACDSIMKRLKKPTGLIRYTNEIELKNEAKKKNIRPYFYITISFIFVAAFIYYLNASTKPQLIFLRGIGAPFLASESTITNKFTLKIKHQGSEHYPVTIELSNPQLRESIGIQTSENPIMLNKAEKKIFIFFKFNSNILKSGTIAVKLNLKDTRTGNIVSTKEVTLVGPMD
ncbi:MAG: cytochrome c oxidase accessory protein CcoG [Bdellovibrionales bacterium CG12_big_fil_rev_8_21_14_0_65_38_15]|nr:MAG: cytochrome c oxidase accessory protein CcoG [Bdellovibrionales bacterium CG22_combo_CG10-13_8_21_14_all_38_13]PIQ56995.1 MAG: cytochrome c oxidase accessory protein CcoG [Bdellovibrionales bacterium CG12_big_fil_rev_8_21_14_0_65_38_15]PIR29044.1 MAG: cytochrome c oxidase accessory protein CcoG [Bdellovibrionales bacterium CG11_big_fil_rev_8_21_14_0_20_38_13]